VDKTISLEQHRELSHMKSGPPCQKHYAKLPECHCGKEFDARVEEISIWAFKEGFRAAALALKDANDNIQKRDILKELNERAEERMKKELAKESMK